MTSTPLQKEKKLERHVPISMLDPRTVLMAIEALNSQALVFRRTGGTHASALLDDEKTVNITEK